MDVYRYTLERSVNMLGPGRRLCWVMLNPSTANETFDDPTIRRVRRFTLERGYNSLVVVNLFAIRATDPSRLDTLSQTEHVIGPLNNEATRASMRRSDDVVFAWGAHPFALRHQRIEFVKLAAEAAGHVPLCLGRTKTGAPRHPLYVKASQPFEVF